MSRGHRATRFVRERPVKVQIGPSGPGDNAVLHSLDRRTAPRARCRWNASALFLVRPSYLCHQASVWDVCPDGVALLLAEPLAPGTLLALRLAPKGTEPFPTRLAEVTHLRTFRGGIWVAGCRLRRPLDPSEVSALVERE